MTMTLRQLTGVFAATLATACGGGNEPSATPANLEIVTGNGQSAPVGSAVPVAPTVLVTDESGNPVAGARVTFTPASGGGNVQGGIATTGPDGLAHVGAWELGTTTGTNTLNASVSGVPSVAFSATATPGSPVRVVAVTLTNQVGLVGTTVAPDPAVRVEDQFGNGVSGVPVTFAVTAGGGSVTGATTTTNANGVATVGSWTLGPSAGTNTLTATAQPPGLNGNPVTFTVVGATSAYDIDLRFLGSMTPSQTQAFQNARNRLEGIILGDIPPVTVNRPAGDCLPNQPALNEIIDDLIIYAEVAAIDGPGKTLGQAGPCIIRSSGSLPAVGVMQFDVADLDNLEQAGLLQSVILHEMLHVIGFGAIWTNKGLLSGATTTDPFFTGAQAIAAFNSIGGNAFVGNRVPVEGTGGPGTRNSHWRETVFKSELMTGFLNSGAIPLSVVTVASLADMGYTVDTGGADPFTIVPPFTAPSLVTRAAAILLDDAWKGPLFEVDPDGSVRRIPRP
jgi:hypothetical protein